MTPTSNLFIVAGPNGSGKTTFVQELLPAYPYAYLSADLIAAEMRPDDPARAQVAAGRIFLEQLDLLVGAGRSLIVESTLSGQALAGTISRLKQQGYTVVIAYIFLDTPELCIERVARRVERGGHHVPAQDVRRRYYRSKRNFWNVYRLQADQWYVYHNAESSFDEVAAGRRGEYAVTNDLLFALFSRDLVD